MKNLQDITDKLVNIALHELFGERWDSLEDSDDDIALSEVQDMFDARIFEMLEIAHRAVVKVGDIVKWHDPDTKARDLSRLWTVDEIKGDVICISTEGSEAEVLAQELEIV